MSGFEFPADWPEVMQIQRKNKYHHPIVSPKPEQIATNVVVDLDNWR